ncbi:MAG: hypothetical protein JXA82_09300 [Sedimentisphaerales bacterium]|nr:hypothetical protein [Sedimentisphaerales bacterium]
MKKLGQWVYSFLEAGRTEEPEQLCGQFGEKGAALSKLAKADLPVPPGFLITSEARRAFLEQGGKWPAELSKQIQKYLRRLEKETGGKYGKGHHPLLLSVSSSMTEEECTLSHCGLGPDLADLMEDETDFCHATLQFIRAFAGLVKGLTDTDFVEAGLDKYPPERVGRKLVDKYLAFYKKRTGHKFPTRPFDQLKQCIIAMFQSSDLESSGGAVVYVQQELSPKVSGKIFTQDPKDAFAEQMRIECTFGYEPCHGMSYLFLVDRERLSVSVQIPSSKGNTEGDESCKPGLTEEQVRELAQLALKTEMLFGHPVEIEFGYVDDRFVFFQEHKIDGLEGAYEMETIRFEEIERIDTLVTEEERTWVLSGLDEDLRYPTPLTWDLVCGFMSGNGGLRRMIRMLGYRPSRRRCEKSFLELMGGRIYAEPDRLAGLFGECFPYVYDLDKVIQDRSVMDRAPDRLDRERIGWLFLSHLPGVLLTRRRISRTMKRFRKVAKQRFDHEVLPVFLAWVYKKREQDLSGFSEEQLLLELDGRCRTVLEEFGPEVLLPGFVGQAVFASLQKILVQLMGSQHGRDYAVMLTSGLDGDIGYAQEQKLHTVARGQASLNSFLEEYGHRVQGELELSTPRWREDPSSLMGRIAQIQNNSHSSLDIYRELRHQRQQAQEDLFSHLQCWGGTMFQESIERDLAVAQTLLPCQKVGRHYWMMGYELIRIVLQELALRWELGEGIYYLTREEMNGLIEQREERVEQIRQRRIRRAALRRLELPDVIDTKRWNELEPIAGGTNDNRNG